MIAYSSVKILRISSKLSYFPLIFEIKFAKQRNVFVQGFIVPFLFKELIETMYIKIKYSIINLSFSFFSLIYLIKSGNIDSNSSNDSS